MTTQSYRRQFKNTANTIKDLYQTEILHIFLSEHTVLVFPGTDYSTSLLNLTWKSKDQGRKGNNDREHLSVTDGWKYEE